MLHNLRTFNNLLVNKYDLVYGSCEQEVWTAL